MLGTNASRPITINHFLLTLLQQLSFLCLNTFSSVTFFSSEFKNPFQHFSYFLSSPLREQLEASLRPAVSGPLGLLIDTGLQNTYLLCNSLKEEFH